MDEPSIAYEDRWGTIIDRPAVGFIEIRWFDTTTAMSGDDFKRFLTTFADLAVQLRRPGVLIDSTAFGMSRANMDPAWRDAHIVPKYNAAKIANFAFHMPAGMPAIGAPPAAQGPADFPTAYFATREDALRWLGALA